MNPKYKEGDVLYWAGYYYGNPFCWSESRNKLGDVIRRIRKPK